MNPAWRERLRLAVERSGKKHSVIAWEAGIAPETLSRILTGSHPRVETLAAVAHAAGETVGWVLGEEGYEYSREEREALLAAAKIVQRMLKETDQE